MNHTYRNIALAVAVCCLGASALAVMPATWTHSNEADFAKGQFSGTAVTSRGEVMLSRQVQVLMKADAAPPVVSAIAASGKALYVASGSQNVIFKIEPGKPAVKFAEPPGVMVTSLLWTGDDLLAGTAGDKGGIYRIDAKGAVAPLWVADKTRYVWAMLAGPKGSFYAATGPTAAVYAITATGKAELLYEAPAKLAKNILCLAAGSDGTLYAGTDTNGLVIAIDADPSSKKTGRVILDAQEKEVSSLVVDDKGNIYAGTTDVSHGDGGSMQAAIQKAMKVTTTAKSSKQRAGGLGTTLPQTASAATSETAEDATDGNGDDEPDEADGSEGDDETPSSPIIMQMAKHSVPVPSMADMGEAPGKGGGNSVYRIAPDGLVDTIFQRPVTILAMALQDGKLILATGNGGALYSLSLDGQEVVQLAKTEAHQITALASDKGQIYFASSNKGSVGVLEQELAKEGTFTSKAWDARQIAKWGKMQLSAKAAAKGSVTISTRSGNVADPDDKSWGPWSAEQSVDNGYLGVSSPAGRYFQYRLKFTCDGKVSPCISRVEMVHQVGNLAPAIQQVAVAAMGKDGMMPMGPPRRGGGAPAGGGDNEDHSPKSVRQINIRASDPNNDHLQYSIFFRAVDSQSWIKIADKLSDAQYAWDTRTVGDGTYEIKIVASDSPSNPPSLALEAVKISKPLVIDNTPPVVKELTAKVDGMKVVASGQAIDASRIAAIYYSIDSQDEWTAVAASDGICDCNDEKFDFQTKDLKAGSHRLTVKVEDIYRNVGYSSATINVAEQK